MKRATVKYLAHLRLRLELERMGWRAAWLCYWTVWRSVQKKLGRPV